MVNSPSLNTRERVRQAADGDSEAYTMNASLATGGRPQFSTLVFEGNGKSGMTTTNVGTVVSITHTPDDTANDV